MIERLKNESLMDYEERLYKNRIKYGLEWEDINELLGLEQHPTTTRIRSVGYLRRVEQEREVIKERNERLFDKSIMIMNDVHLPFERPDVLNEIRKQKDNITHLVFAGDLLDCKSISSFRKMETWRLEEEILYATEWLKEVRDILDDGQEIILINGNHEERWTTEIQKMFQVNIQPFLSPNILDMIVNGYELYHDSQGKVVTCHEGIDNCTFIPHWFTNIDDRLIVAHPKNFSQVDGKMCENTTAHFLNRGENFELVVFGHTHKYSEMTVSRRGNKYAVENGCLCLPAEYADTGRLNFTPQHYCYTIVNYNYDEPLNYNDIEVVHLPEIEDKTVEDAILDIERRNRTTNQKVNNLLLGREY